MIRQILDRRTGRLPSYRNTGQHYPEPELRSLTDIYYHNIIILLVK